MAAIRQDPLWHDFFYTELTTGLRRGELCGLKWKDFDDETGTLKICRTIHIKKGGGLSEGDTKTYAGTRTILLPHSTAQLLRERKRAALTEWIFPDPLKPENPTHPSSAYRQLKKILSEAGLPNIRFHDLRHTFATNCIEGGADIKSLSQILGHSDVQISLNRYVHPSMDSKRRCLESLSRFYGQIRGQERGAGEGLF